MFFFLKVYSLRYAQEDSFFILLSNDIDGTRIGTRLLIRVNIRNMQQEAQMQCRSSIYSGSCIINIISISGVFAIVTSLSRTYSELPFNNQYLQTTHHPFSFGWGSHLLQCLPDKLIILPLLNFLLLFNSHCLCPLISIQLITFNFFFPLLLLSPIFIPIVRLQDVAPIPVGVLHGG